MNRARPDIFHYHNHLEFLTEWLAFRKASHSGFSLRALAKRAGLATGYLPMVISGKRALSLAALAKIMPHLGLNEREQSFLENLVHLGTSRSHEAQVHALDRMQRYQQFQKNSAKESQVYEYLTHWYYVAIREMATRPGFQLDPQWIQSQLRFNVSLKEVKTAVQFLIENGYLKVADDGTVSPPEQALDCSGDVYRVALGKFHREIFRLSGQAIDQVPRQERHIEGHTCALSPENFTKAQQIIAEALKQVRQLGENENHGESVYHLEVALFPMTHSKGSEK